jgi:hypothetical protein
VKSIGSEKVVRVAGPAIEDNGKIRMGTMSPSFPPVREQPANLADDGRLRIGTMSPTFPPVRLR